MAHIEEIAYDVALQKAVQKALLKHDQENVSRIRTALQKHDQERQKSQSCPFWPFLIMFSSSIFILWCAAKILSLWFAI